MRFRMWAIAALMAVLLLGLFNLTGFAGSKKSKPVVRLSYSANFEGELEPCG